MPWLYEWMSRIGSDNFGIYHPPKLLNVFTIFSLNGFVPSVCNGEVVKCMHLLELDIHWNGKIWIIQNTYLNLYVIILKKGRKAGNTASDPGKTHGLMFNGWLNTVN